VSSFSLTRALAECRHPPRHIWSASGVRIWKATEAGFESACGVRIPIPDPVYFRGLNGTSLSRDTCVIKFSSRYDQFFQSYKTTCGKMPYRTIWMNIKEINPNPEADDLRNLISYTDRHVYSRYRAFYSRRTKSRCH